MYYREGSRDREFEPEVNPPTSRTTLVEIVHRAIFQRAKALERDRPGTRTEVEFQDDEPRAVLWIYARDGSVLWKEFVETAYSVSDPEREKEYIATAQEHQRLALHYPAMATSEEHVIERLADLWVKVKKLGVQDRVIIQGFLYDDSGRTIREI